MYACNVLNDDCSSTLPKNTGFLANIYSFLLSSVKHVYSSSLIASTYNT